MNEFWKAVILTAVPIGVIGFVPVLGWLLDIGLIIAALIIALVLFARGRRRSGAGVFAGLGIGVVVLGVSCFVLFPNILD